VSVFIIVLLYPLLSILKLALVVVNNNKADEPDIGDIGPVGVKLAVYFATPLSQWKLVILPLKAFADVPDAEFPMVIEPVDVRLTLLILVDPNCTPLRYTFN
jgi:hypothetical protein